MPARIVITGAPGSGKTECITHLRTMRRFEGFVFFDELARALLGQDPTFRDHPLRFHTAIFEQQAAREAEYANQSFISDRGTVDGFAFHPETMAAVNTTIEREYRRYSLVIQLGTTASLGAEYYQVDDIRREPPEAALVIEEALKRVWQRHPAYHFVPASDRFETKLQKVVAITDPSHETESELTQ